MSNRSRRYAGFAWLAVLLALIVSAALTQAIGYRHWTIASQNAVIFAEAFISLAALPFFILARRHFGTDLRRVYLMLGVGIGLYGLAQLQIPVVVLLKSYFWVDSGLISLPFLASTILIFISIRRFTHILGVTSRLALPWVAITLPLAGAIAVACLPLVIPGSVLSGVTPGLGLAMWSGLLALLSAGLVSRAAWRVTSIYSVPLGRLNTALTVWFLGAAHYVGASLYVPLEATYAQSGMFSLFMVIAALLFVWAGVSFNLIGEVEAIDPKHKQPPTSLNIITYTASLAADQEAIDGVLDGARSVSAMLAPDAALTPEMQRQLASVYLALEKHLTTQEKLQVYTPQSLRQQVSKALRLDQYGAETFWPIIQQDVQSAPLPQTTVKTP